MSKQQEPRKVLVLDGDVHQALKGTARECGMKLQSLGNSILRAWEAGEFFRCPGNGLAPIPRGIAAESVGIGNGNGEDERG